MICISFNIRGLEGVPKYISLKRFVKSNKEYIYLFQEMMLTEIKACEYFMKILKYWEICVIDVDS